MSKNNSNALRFNKIVDKFLTDLQSILPEEKDITILKSQIAVTTMLFEGKVLQSFIETVYPFKEHIMSKNEDFFLGDEISDKKDYLSEALHLSDLWKNKLSENNKEIIWKYFQVMTVLAEKSL